MCDPWGAVVVSEELVHNPSQSMSDEEEATSADEEAGPLYPRMVLRELGAGKAWMEEATHFREWVLVAQCEKHLSATRQHGRLGSQSLTNLFWVPSSILSSC